MRRTLASWALSSWRSSAGLVLVLLLVQWALKDCGGSRAVGEGGGSAAAVPQGSGFQGWAQGELDRGQPEWKRRLLQGSPGAPVTFRATWYAASEGEVVGAWCKGGKSIALRWGHVATDWDHWPPGSVFWAPRLRCLLVAVDRGAKVNGPRRVDVYMPNGSVLATRGPLCEGPLVLHSLGRIAWEDAQ